MTRTPRPLRMPWAALAVALAAALGCAPLLGPGRAREALCWPSFPYRDGWLGADGAASIPLGRGRSLWLFADTFVGAPGQTERREARIVNSSIGLSTCRSDGRFSVRYLWRTAADGTPSAFFERSGGGWWWPFGGVAYGGRLYVGLLGVEAASPSAPPGTTFQLDGTALARVDARGDDPLRWRVEVLPLSERRDVFPVSALVVQGSYLYLFAFLDRGDGRAPRILTRLPLASLAGDAPDPAAAFETLGEGGDWLPGLRPGDARVLMHDDATEMSVRFHPELGKWLALYSFPELSAQFPGVPASDAVRIRTADALEGPWSDRRLLFRVPELAPGRSPPPDPHTACYGAKEQGQFARPGSVTFTYVCNLFPGAGEDPLAALGRIQEEMDLYRPIAAEVTLDPEAGAPRGSPPRPPGAAPAP